MLESEFTREEQNKEFIANIFEKMDEAMERAAMYATVFDVACKV